MYKYNGAYVHCYSSIQFQLIVSYLCSLGRTIFWIILGVAELVLLMSFSFIILAYITQLHKTMKGLRIAYSVVLIVAHGQAFCVHVCIFE